MGILLKWRTISKWIKTTGSSGAKKSINILAIWMNLAGQSAGSVGHRSLQMMLRFAWIVARLFRQWSRLSESSLFSGLRALLKLITSLEFVAWENPSTRKGWGLFIWFWKKPNPCTTVNSGLLPLVFEPGPLKEVVKQVAESSKRQKSLFRLTFVSKDFLH